MRTVFGADSTSYKAWNSVRSDRFFSARQVCAHARIRCNGEMRNRYQCARVECNLLTFNIGIHEIGITDGTCSADFILEWGGVETSASAQGILMNTVGDFSSFTHEVVGKMTSDEVTTPGAVDFFAMELTSQNE